MAPLLSGLNILLFSLDQVKSEKNLKLHSKPFLIQAKYVFKPDILMGAVLIREVIPAWFLRHGKREDDPGGH